MTLYVLASIFAVLGIVCILLPFHVAMTGLCFLALGAVCLALRLLRGKKHERNAPEGADAPEFVVALGAQVQGDQPSLTLKKRLDLALEYLTGHPQASVVVSGGQGADEAYTEASVMAKYLTARGVDESRVLLEEQANDTRENLEFSRTLAQAHGMRTDRVLIITSDFHLCRAKYLAKKLGMEPYGLASRTSPEVLRVNYLLREVFAFVKAAL